MNSSSSTSVSPANSASRRRRAPTSGRRSRRKTASQSSSAECGYRACRFIQRLCRNTIGPDAGSYLRLRPWQHDILHGMFTVEGKPTGRYALVGLPRKNGKSTLGAALALYALVAMDEEGAQVFSCAGDRTQASIVFNEAKRMVQAEPDLARVVRVQRWHLEGPKHSIYRVLSADAKLQQGLNPSFVIFDEVHVQPNRDLWDAMVLGMGARARPMIVGITTAGWDRDSLAWDLYQRGRNGEFFYWWSEPKSFDADWRDPDVWHEANPALGDFLFEEAVSEDVRITPESSFRRYHLNQWTTTHAAWFPHGAWGAIAEPSRRFDPSRPFVLFLDGAWANDSTGLVACTIDSPHLSVLGHWTPDEYLGHVDMAAIEAGVRAAVAHEGFRSIAFDPARFQDFFARLEADGMEPVEWPTNSLRRMVPACQDFYEAVLDERITHDGDERLAAHIANAALKEDRHGPRIVKETKGSSKKIDLAVCAVGAYSEARRMAATPAAPRVELITL